MKLTCYLLLTAATLLLAPTAARAATGPAPRTESPTEVQRKNAARARVAVAKAKSSGTFGNASHATARKSTRMNHALRLLLGLEGGHHYTTPAQLDRQLHVLQVHLKAKAKHESWARRQRCQRMLN